MNSKTLIILLISIFIIVSTSKSNNEFYVTGKTSRMYQTSPLLKLIKLDRFVTPLMTTTLEFNPFGLGFAKPMRTTTLKLIIFNNYDTDQMK